MFNVFGRGYKQGSCGAGGVVTNHREVTVPLVTSEKADFQNTHFLKGAATLRSKGWAFGDLTDRLETRATVRKHW